jgi:hypothetical protein
MMKSVLEKVGLVCMLALTGMLPLACAADTTGDGITGKTMSELDIGDDVTMDKGESKQLTATVKYTDGTSRDVTSSPDLVWNIDDTDVATVSKSGMLLGTRAGATKITAKYATQTADQALVVR